MNRIAMNGKWRLVLFAGLCCMLGLTLLCLAPNTGWGFTHVTVDAKKSTRKIRVAVILLKSLQNGISYNNADPWLLPVLNHSPYKPDGWELENPLAPATLINDSDLKTSGDKYAADGKGGGVVDAYHNWYLNGKAFGAPLTKDDPAYWVVKLDQVSLEALCKFDLLILNGHDAVTLSNIDRNNIQFLLEHGATIWMNNSQRKGFQVSNLYPPIQFNPDVNWYKDRSATHLIKVDSDSWLLNSVYQLTDQEVDNLRDNMSRYNYILSGVAGYNGGENSQIKEVVRHEFFNYNSALNHWDLVESYPNIAAGRQSNGLMVVSSTDLIGGTSDWWEHQHNYAPNITNLNMWPYARSLNLTGNAPNKHDTYIACTKFIFNMMNHPATWNMAGGNLNATRAVPQSIPTPLRQGWSTDFTTFGDPVSQDNYVAVTGYGPASTSSPLDAGELRVYRARKVTDDTGTVQDYPYGLYTQDQSLLTPTFSNAPAWWTASFNWRNSWLNGANYAAGDVVAHFGILYICTSPHTAAPATEPGVAAGWTTVWDPYTYFPKDAENAGSMDLCFTAPAPAGHWVGSPIFGKITLFDYSINPAQPQPFTATVLYALQRFNEQVNGTLYTFYRPHCYLIDPYRVNGVTHLDVGRTIGQVGVDLWTNNNNLLIRADVNGLPQASMSLMHNHLVITTFGKAVAKSPRIYMIDATSGDVRVQLGSNPEWGSTFRLSGPASDISAQVDFEANGFEAGESSEAVTSSTYNPNAPTLRRETVDMLAVTGEYYPPNLSEDVQVGQSALFLIPPTIMVKMPPSAGSFSRIPPDLALNGQTIGDPNNQFRKDNILCIKAAGSTIKITFRTWDAFFNENNTNPIITLPATLSYTPESAYTMRSGGVQRQSVQVSELAMGYPVILPGSLVNNMTGQLTLHPLDGDNVSNFGYTVDAPPLVYNNQVVIGTNTYLTTALPSLASTVDTLSPQAMRIAGTLSALRLTHSGFSAYGAPMTYPYNGEVAWQFRGDTLGPKDTKDTNHGLSGLDQFLWRSDFPYPTAAGKDTLYAIGSYEGYGDYLSDFYYPLQQADFVLRRWSRGTLYALDSSPTRYLQQVVTGADNYADVNQGTHINPFGYQDPRSQVTFKGSLNNNHIVVTISDTANPNSFTYTVDGVAHGPVQIPPPTAPKFRPQDIPLTGTTSPVFVSFPKSFGYAKGDSWEINPVADPADPNSMGQRRQLLLRGVAQDALAVGKRALLRIDPPGNASTTWDLGAITAVRQDPATGPDGYYWVTFDRDRPDDAALSAVADTTLSLLVATSVPYLSHVRAWNSITGEEPVRQYTVGGVTATRLSEGISALPIPGAPANPMRSISQRPLDQSVMIEFLSQNPVDPTPVYTCHNETPLDGKLTALPNDTALLNPASPDFQGRPHMYLPRLSNQNSSNLVVNVANPVTLAPVQNYTVDYLTGRVQLSPQAAAEFADRFVEVYYFTNELVGTTKQKVFHAEIMHVPSPVEWQYQFADAIPDNGPVVVNDTIYVSANRNLPNSSYWQPVVYAFAAHPADPFNVQPLWVQPLPVKSLTPAWTAGRTYQMNDVVVGSDNAIYLCIQGNVADATTQPTVGADWFSYWVEVTPYRCVTSPTPTTNGVLVGTAIPWNAKPWAAGQAYIANDAVWGSDGQVYLCTTPHTADATNQPITGTGWKSNWTRVANQMTAFTDQGLIISDGQRLLRNNSDGVVTWQGAGTKDFDPAAVDAADPITAQTGLLQQNFTLLTRIHRLPNGNILACDTGANRVVEMDRAGTVIWQFPDSDLTYQDPDRVYTDNADAPALSAALLAALHKPTEAQLRPNGPRDVRRYTHDVTYVPPVLAAQRTGGVVTLTTPNLTANGFFGLSVGSQVNITVEGVKDSATHTNFNGKFTALVYNATSLVFAQPTLPDATADNNTGVVMTDRLLPVTVTWLGQTYTANIRWESTLIADAGNNRILEVDRPLVRFVDPTSGRDIEQSDNNTVVARGYHYRPDVTYTDNSGTIKYLTQQVEVVADANTLALGNTMFTQPITFTAVTRFAGSDTGTIDTQLDVDPVMNGVRTRELIAAVGNLVPDPYLPQGFVHTVHISRPLLLPSAPSRAPQGYSRLSTTVTGVAADNSSVTADTTWLTIGTTITLQATPGPAPMETAVIKAIDPATNKVTFTAPLRNTYAANATALLYPEPSYLVPHAAAPTINALCKTSVLQTAGSGTVIKVADASKFHKGETVGLANLSLTPPHYELLGTITADPNLTTNEITVAKAPQQSYPIDADPTKTSVLFSFGTERYEYSRVRQLDLVTLQNPTEVHALVVDQAGVREVTTDPTSQGSVCFEMTSEQYNNALNDGLWNYIIPQQYPTASLLQKTALATALNGWKSDHSFAPVAVLRTVPGPRNANDDPTVYQHKVRYLISQASDTYTPWINDQALKRIHLFEARWVNSIAGNGWGIVDGDANYLVYPDPLSPTFPNLPGGTYPLNEPFSLDADE